MSRAGPAFPEEPAIATADPDVQRLRAAVEAKLPSDIDEKRGPDDEHEATSDDAA